MTRHISFANVALLFVLWDNFMVWFYGRELSDTELQIKIDSGNFYGEIGYNTYRGCRGLVIGFRKETRQKLQPTAWHPNEIHTIYHVSLRFADGVVKEFNTFQTSLWYKENVEPTDWKPIKQRKLETPRYDAVGRQMRVNDLVTFARGSSAKLYFGIITEIKPSCMMVKDVRDGKEFRMNNPSEALLIDDKTQTEILMLKLTKE